MGRSRPRGWTWPWCRHGYDLSDRRVGGWIDRLNWMFGAVPYLYASYVELNDSDVLHQST